MDDNLEQVQFFIQTLKPPTDADAKLARESHDWFEACFGAKAFLKPWSSAEDFHATFARPPNKFFEAQREFDCARQEEVGSLLKKWLVHNSECHQTGQVWPFVRCAKLWGPWRMLQGGCVFVDLPGTGDSNSVRKQIAQRELSRADFLCICSRIDRATTNRTSIDWLVKASRDLPPDSAAYVCTKADDVSPEEVRRDHKLSAKTTRLECALKRNDVVKKRMHESYPHIPVYCVSARDYSRLIGFEHSYPS